MYKCTETRSKQERQREGERKEEMQSCLNPGYLPCAALLSASLNLSALDLACPGPSVKLEVRYVAPKRTAKNPILGSGKWFKIHVFKSGPPQCQDMWLSRQRTCSQRFYTTCDFFRRHATKNMGSVDPKMGCKIWTPFWGPPNCFFLSRPPKRGPDFRPHFEVHIARFFSRSVTLKKVIPE